jgi:hypothetical protein
MIITPMIYIEDIIMITGIQLSASIGTEFFGVLHGGISGSPVKVCGLGIDLH